MNKQASVSCVLPVYNGERFIGEAIESVLSQTTPVTEIIVVDDGSTDATVSRIGEFGSRVCCLQQPNKGVTSARNRGLRRATAEFVAFIDADDLWSPEKVELQLAVLNSNPQLGACLTYMRNFWMPEVVHERDQGAERLTRAQPGVGSSFMARARLFAEIGPLDESLQHRDIQEWLLRLDNHGWGVQTLPDVLVRRRVHGNNQSRGRSDPGEQELLRLARDAIARTRRGSGG